MTVLAGPFAIATTVLALGGALKALDPADTAHALTALGLPGGRVLVRIGGAIEAVVAIGALVTGNAVLAAIVAASYVAFAVVVTIALRSGKPISSCGCLGKIDTPPSLVHVAVDLVCAAVAVGAAVAATNEIAVPDVLADQPLLGIPFLLLVAVGTGLVLLALTALPKTLAAARAVR
ncbi:MAG: MauE/DoxX family redox-associated membrane protein [Acidimicrobiia bacterium]